MSVPELRDADFGIDTLNMRSKILMYVGSDACPHCRTFLPVFNRFSAQNPHIKTAYLNLKKMSESFMEKLDYIIQNLPGIPAIYVFNNGVPTAAFSGERTIQGISDFVDQFYL